MTIRRRKKSSPDVRQFFSSDAAFVYYLRVLYQVTGIAPFLVSVVSEKTGVSLPSSAFDEAGLQQIRTAVVRLLEGLWSPRMSMLITVAGETVRVSLEYHKKGHISGFEEQDE